MPSSIDQTKLHMHAHNSLQISFLRQKMTAHTSDSTQITYGDQALAKINLRCVSYHYKKPVEIRAVTDTHEKREERRKKLERYFNHSQQKKAKGDEKHSTVKE